MNNVHVYPCRGGGRGRNLLESSNLEKRFVLVPKAVDWLYEKARECHMILSEIKVQGNIPYVVNNGPIVNQQHKLVSRTRLLFSYLL